LTKNSQYPLKITTSKYEIIAAGIIHLIENEVKFELANLVIIYKFVSDSKEARFETEVIKDELVVNLYNFKNSLGEGRINPIEIGTLNQRKLFATFFINTNEDTIRQFNYSFMLEN